MVQEAVNTPPNDQRGAHAVEHDDRLIADGEPSGVRRQRMTTWESLVA